MTGRRRVLIIGGGFAGLSAARALSRAPVAVTVVDRQNHHLFQPLLYQVATASLSPADIAAPIRWILRRQANAEVLLGEVVAFDLATRSARLADGGLLPFDTLVLAAGVESSYFGHERAWAPIAPGLKTIDDARAIRERFLLSFERAEREADADRRRSELTFVVVGGGPTGVELAGAMAEIVRSNLPGEFRRVDPTTARILLLDAAPRLLVAYPEEQSARAKLDLERLGVEVVLDRAVSAVEPGVVIAGDERIETDNIFWAAGTKASPLAAELAAAAGRVGVEIELAKGGRVPVGPDLAVAGLPDVFVLGDLARVAGRDGSEVPALAPSALQMGRFVGRLIRSDAQADAIGAARPPRPAFRYRDKGSLATIGRSRAVGSIGPIRVAGPLAWLVWLFVHLMYLVGFRNRVIVLFTWAWSYLTFQRGARLISERRAATIGDAAEGSDLPGEESGD